jgi:glycine/D-amino acid oxidase-like deaminating enzyme
MEDTTHPTWDEGVAFPSFKELSGAVSCDVAIIGGGITGILSAYFLSKKGKRVIVIEKSKLATGATPMTTACTTQIIDTDMADLVKIYGEEKAKAIIESHGTAIQTLDDIVTAEQIECEFMRCPNYIFATSKKEDETLKEECDLGKKLGIEMEWKNDTIGNLHATSHARVERQAKFHPLKFLRRIVDICQKNGVQFFENTEAVEIDSSGKQIKTPHGTIMASWIISATYQPFNQPLGLFLKKGMYRSYVLELHAEKGKLPEAIYEDMKNPYHYFRVDNKETHDRIIFGGEDHREDLPIDENKSFKALEDSAVELLGPTVFTITKRWHGPILEPSDGLPLIGLYKNILVAAAFSGNGMTYSTISARMFDDIIHGRENSWESLYEPGRTPTPHSLLVKGKDYFSELVGGALKNTLKKEKDD